MWPSLALAVAVPALQQAAAHAHGCSMGHHGGILLRHGATLHALPSCSRRASVSLCTQETERGNADGHGVLETLYSVLRPSMDRLDSITGGFAMTFTDTAPWGPMTPPGAAFLSTNIWYSLAGGAVLQTGNVVLGLILEAAAAASFWYHYEQLLCGERRASAADVQLALLVDYVFAFAGMGMGAAGTLQLFLDTAELPAQLLSLQAFALGCILLSWARDESRWYLWWHSLWHIVSAMAATQVCIVTAGLS